jgi:hypothetical protein
VRPSPNGSKQDLQALATGQNTLQNVVGAVGQGLVPTAAAFLGGQLAGSGAYTQQILGGLAPALAFGTVAAAKQAAGAIGGFLFPSPDYTTDSTGNTFKDGTLYRAAEVDEDISPNTPGLV